MYVRGIRLLCAGLALGVAVACTGGGTENGSHTSSTSGPSAGGSEGPAKGAETAVAALRTAADDVHDGTAFDLEHEQRSGDRVWEVKVASGDTKQYKVDVVADGSTVVTKHKDDDLDDDVTKLGKAKLSAADAARRAAREHSGTVDSLEIDTLDDGTTVWQVELDGNGGVTEYKLDADSGKSLRTEAPDD